MHGAGKEADVRLDVAAWSGYRGEVPRTAASGGGRGGAGQGEMKAPGGKAGQRDQAIHLLRLVAAALPAMMQYAQLLQSHAERLSFPSEAPDALGFGVGRLEEAYEALRQPPQ